MKNILTLVFLLVTTVTLYSQTDNNESENVSENVSNKEAINSETTTQTAITIINQFPDYPATPGDIYDIYLLTSVNEEKSIAGFVDNNYDIDLSFIGKVNVTGLKYTEVQEVLKEKLNLAYPGSIVNVVIRAPGQFRVTLQGEVQNAQILDTMGLRTLAEIIKEKTTAYASIRDIEIKSEDGTVNQYDLFKFQRYADKENNPFLRPNDVITIKEYDKKVQINGQVKRPGFYELLESDSLADIISLYGDGFTKTAEKKEIEIKRFINEENSYGDDTLYIDGEIEDLSKIKINDGDIITIKNKMEYISKVVIQGAISPANNSRSAAGNSVSNKEVVPITSGARVSTVLKDMRGTFNLTSDLETAYVLRDGEKLPVNLESIKEQIGHEDDIVLKDKDILIVPFRQLQVFVAGSVNNAGAVPFIENRTAKYYIGLAGGFDRTENLFRSYSIRNVYGEKVHDEAIISPEDVIWVNRDHPISYIQEYGGYIVTLASAFILAKSLEDFAKSIYKDRTPAPLPGI